MKITYAFLGMLMLALAAPNANAQFESSMSGDFIFAPSLFYHSGVRARNSKEQKSFLVYDVKAAYQIKPSIFLGVTYQGEQTETKTSGYSSASLNNSSKGSRTSLGPSLGYVLPTFHVIFTYFVDSKWTLNTTTSTSTDKYAYAGDGMQLDLGYKIAWGSVLFGPQLSYKMFNYKKLATNGAEAETLSPKLQESNLEPSLVFLFNF